MKWKFTLLVCLAIGASIIGQAQNNGDYRSNIAPPPAVGLWTANSTWQVYNSATLTWDPATTPPTDANTGRITIQANDSVILNVAASIDDVVVDGIFVMFNLSTPFVVTLANGASDDLVVNGRTHVALNATLNGAGNISVPTGGQLLVSNAGTVGVSSVTNAGLISFYQAAGAALVGTSIASSGTIAWTGGPVSVNNSSIVNTGTFFINQAVSATMTTVGASSITNATGGLISRTGATGTFSQIQPALTNNGTIRGVGELYFLTTTANTGTVEPGNSPGILRVINTMVSARPTTVNIEIPTTGNVAGVNYDQLQFNSVAAGTVNLTGVTINVTGLESDPLGTIYTIMTYPSPAGSGFTGTPTLVMNEPMYTLQVNSNTVTLTKTATLPLSWGEFHAIAQDNNKVMLKWSTLQEINTSSFAVEYSNNGTDYASVGTLSAQGNSDRTTNYSFLFSSPDTRAVNYFRIRQFDIDGKSTLSPIRHVRFEKGAVVPVTAYPNPVRDKLTLNVQTRNISVQLHSFSGAMITSRVVQPGQHQIDMSRLPAGFYQLSVFEDGKRIDMLKIVKQ